MVRELNEERETRENPQPPTVHDADDRKGKQGVKVAERVHRGSKCKARSDPENLPIVRRPVSFDQCVIYDQTGITHQKLLRPRTHPEQAFERLPEADFPPRDERRVVAPNGQKNHADEEDRA